MLTLQQLQIEVSAWGKHNFPNNQPHHPLLGLTEEVGELSHAHLKLEQGIRGTVEQHMEAKVDAVGDIMIYLAHYCALNGLDLQLCTETAWAEVKERDWQKNPQSGKVG